MTTPAVTTKECCMWTRPMDQMKDIWAPHVKCHRPATGLWGNYMYEAWENACCDDCAEAAGYAPLFRQWEQARDKAASEGRKFEERPKYFIKERVGQ